MSNDDDDIDIVLRRVASNTVTESKQLKCDERPMMRYFDSRLLLHNQLQRGRNTWDSLNMDDLYMELSRIIFIICSVILHSGQTSVIPTLFLTGTSTNAATRNARAGKYARRHHQMLLSIPIPAQRVILTVTANKVQLIKLICTSTSNTMQIWICDGQLADRHDLRTTHEEADVVIIQQSVHLATTGINNIRVVADVTDVIITPPNS